MPKVALCVVTVARVLERGGRAGIECLLSFINIIGAIFQQ
jgi:hypothetical protein